ncbi:MAG: tetratricopeptide repeat protein [Candidatus Aminicenantes bacterium]|nr:tetratricopeptide repeat protein [Candidatus Aminicenantes bacterium]
MHSLKSVMILSAAVLLVLSGLSGQFQGKARLGGEVYDEDKNPVEGAKVSIVHPERLDKPLATKTNKKGKWAVMGLGTGQHMVTVTAAGFAEWRQEVYVSQLDRNPTIVATLKKAQVVDAGPAGPVGLELVEQGNRLFEEKSFEQAAALFEQFLEKNPGAFQTHLNIGNCYRETGAFDKAVAEYNLVIAKVKETNPELKGDVMAGKALAAIGEVHIRQGDLEGAQEFFKQSLDVSPSDETLAYNVGEIYFSNGKVDEAIRYFKLAVEIKPGWPEAHLKLGFSYLNKADYGPAAASMAKYLELAPEAPNAADIKKILESIKK